jgi:hypothetical protein
MRDHHDQAHIQRDRIRLTLAAIHAVEADGVTAHGKCHYLLRAVRLHAHRFEEASAHDIDSIAIIAGAVEKFACTELPHWQFQLSKLRILRHWRADIGRQVEQRNGRAL